ncbi:MAG: hypothetical protein QOF16_1328 [Actinomycetota bacterium]|jgi:hypothetical protein|nr:hypothetical protein [Actinomycetota bacterium]
MHFVTEATGFNGGEPTLGVLKDGTIAVQAFTNVVERKPGVQGDKWKSVYSPPTNGQTLDPYIHVDPVTNRIFSSQLFGGCQLMATSDDGGASWTPSAQCTPVDHQKIGSGPWHDPSNRLYPRAVYTCFNQVADSACSVSPDGGRTWGPQVPVFVGADPSAKKGLDVDGFCGGLEGDPVSGPDGSIYLPREFCGRPYVGVSQDDGVTWQTHAVSPPSGTVPIGYGANNPSVTVDPNGTLYYAWTGTNWHHYIAHSTDHGASWSKPQQVSPPTVGSTTFPEIVAGRHGAVATSYVGTPDTGKGPDDAPKEARWYLYMSYSFDANAAKPHWSTMRVTTDPIEIGCIGRHGPNCGNGNLLDFNGISLSPAGYAVMSYTDGCLAGCDQASRSSSKMVSVAIQTAGPTFR